MPVSERAKQFMPFAALKGLPEALAKKEKIIVPKVNMTDDLAEELDRKMHLIEPGKTVCVTYYAEEEYLRKTGLVSKIDAAGRVLTVVDTKILFGDIAGIEFPDSSGGNWHITGR
jgi:hypothetical protein